MGDVGFVVAGRNAGTIAVIIKQEIRLSSVGGLFVIERCR